MRTKPFYLAVCAIAWVLVAVPYAGRAQEDAGGDEAGSELEEPNPLTIPSEYRYDPAGRRDPFVNPIAPEAQAQGQMIPDVRPPGLPGVLLNEARLNAIARSADAGASVVVIEAPGSRVFVAHAGDEMYDVVIREIGNTEVVFEVKPLDGDDPLAPRARVRRGLIQENE
jgi:hypothetical protein